MNYYRNPAGRPFETNKRIPGLEELTLEEYNLACQEWNISFPEPSDPPPRPTLEEIIEAKILQMIEDGVISPG